uniref:Threonylcarbamoyl-AMP synthase n=1 Tax=Ailuropoda melanoleuca TaxID=9646 RepID=A0A7N5JUW0_AILME
MTPSCPGYSLAFPSLLRRSLGCSSPVLGTVYCLQGCSHSKLPAFCLSCVADVFRYCHVRVPAGLLKDLLPRPVTLVLEHSQELSKDLNLFPSLTGIWIPDPAFKQDLAQVFGAPFALISANLSSQASSQNSDFLRQRVFLNTVDHAPSWGLVSPLVGEVLHIIYNFIYQPKTN